MPLIRSRRQRWKKDELAKRLAAFDHDQLTQLLCELYRAGPDKVRDKIEATVEPAKKKPEPAEDLDGALDEIEDFVALANDGQFMHGRTVGPKRKAQWRHEFRGAFETATRLLRSPEGERAAALLESLVDLADKCRRVCVFRSEDPIEAAKVVVSEHVGALWATVLARDGIEGLADKALPQLLRWERHGWTRGWGSTAERDRRLADVLAEVVRSRPAWERLAGKWKQMLDSIDAEESKEQAAPAGKRGRREADWQRDERFGRLRSARRDRGDTFHAWHERIVEALGSDDELARSIVHHRAVEGPYAWRIQARIAAEQGRLADVSHLVEKALAELPGYNEMVFIALDAGIPLPPAAAKLEKERGLRERWSERKHANGTPSS